MASAVGLSIRKAMLSPTEVLENIEAAITAIQKSKPFYIIDISYKIRTHCTAYLPPQLPYNNYSDEGQQWLRTQMRDDILDGKQSVTVHLECCDAYVDVGYKCVTFTRPIKTQSLDIKYLIASIDDWKPID